MKVAARISEKLRKERKYTPRFQHAPLPEAGYVSRRGGMVSWADHTPQKVRTQCSQA